MLRIAGIALALLTSGTAAAQERLSDYMRGIYEQNCLKQDVSACSQLINAGFGVPEATRARALAVRGAHRLRKDDLDGASADLKAALAIAETPQDQTMAKLDAARGISGITPAWRSAVYADYAHALLRKGDNPGASAAVEKAIALDTRNGLAYLVRGRIEGSQQRWPQAFADIDKAIQIGFADPAERGHAFYLRGIVRGVLGHPPETRIADFTSAISGTPSFVRAYEARGDAYRDLRRYEEAIRDYDQLVAGARDYAPGYNSACWARAAYLKRDFETARTLCDRALALAPEANSYDSAGLVALQQGRSQDAWALYDKAVKGDPKMASALYGRAMAAKRLGRAAEAQRDIAAAMALDASVAADYASYGQVP